MPVVKFKRPDKAPTDPLEVTDPIPEHLDSQITLLHKSGYD